METKRMRIIVEGRKNRGSTTVEAAIIIPVIILCIAAVAYMGLLLQQKAVIQSAAESAAEAGALAWSSGTDVPAAGKPAADDIRNPELYRRIFDSKRENRLCDIEEYALELAARNELIKPVDITVTAELKDYVVYKKLVVRIGKKYRNPLGGLFELLGKSETIGISAMAVSTVNEPAELIRTTDFILDVEKKLENKFPGLKNLTDKTRNTMNNMKNKLSEFLE
jgi:hypothetical protein